MKLFRLFEAVHDALFEHEGNGRKTVAAVVFDSDGNPLHGYEVYGFQYRREVRAYVVQLREIEA